MPGILASEVDVQLTRYLADYVFDVDETASAITRERERRLDDQRALADDADAQVAALDEQLERIGGDYRRGAITPDEWHAFRDEILDERLAEAERASRQRAQVDTIADELNQVEARRVAAQRVAELRASLAGEVAAREGDVDALRAIVGRTFEAVVLHHIGDGLHLLPVVHEHMLRSLHPWDPVEPSRQAAPVQRGHGGT